MVCSGLSTLCLIPDGSDYIAASNTLFFPVGTEDGVINCITISILDDNSIEDDEAFSIRIMNVEDNVFVPVSSTRVYIIDNDSKHMNFCPDLFIIL